MERLLSLQAWTTFGGRDNLSGAPGITGCRLRLLSHTQKETMTPTGSVTEWLDAMKAGDPRAAQKIWERYFDELVRLARKRLGDTPRRVADEEDVVAVAFDRFFRAASRGCYPRLRDRHGLWQLLVTITARKTATQIESLRRQKRGGGKIRGESAFQFGQLGGGPSGIDQVIDDLPTPAFAALAAEEFQMLLDQLDETLRRVAIFKMEGYSNEEIAEQLDVSQRTVERKLHRIRVNWSRGGVP